MSGQETNELRPIKKKIGKDISLFLSSPSYVKCVEKNEVCLNRECNTIITANKDYSNCNKFVYGC